MSPLEYRTMTLQQIHDDLLDTVSDLYYNGGAEQLEPVLDDFERIDARRDVRPSEHLIEVMEELYTHDADLVQPRPLELMRLAVDEMLALATAE